MRSAPRHDVARANDRDGAKPRCSRRGAQTSAGTAALSRPEGRLTVGERMTDDQEVQLVREILEQVVTDRLSERDGLTAIGLVLDPGSLSYDQVALQIRFRVAHRDQ